MRRLAIALGGAAALMAAGCLGVRRSAPKPALTHIGKAPVVLPGHLIGNVLVVEDSWEKAGPYRFIVDTGSSVTLVSPDIARRYGSDEPGPADEPRVRVRSAGGGYALLKAVTLRRLQLGGARFDYVPALVYDCSDLSAQFGVKIDGILGFPLFRNAVLTLDYPNQRAVLRSRLPEDGVPGVAIPFNNADKIPLISVRLGEHRIAALIDSGSASAIDLNPAGLDPAFAFGPVDGPVVSTLAGDQASRVARLSGSLSIGPFDVVRPVASLTDELTSLGGGILRLFTVTFDQRGNEAFFKRAGAAAPGIPPLRGTGISFRKTPAYWKVVGVIPGSPAASAGVAVGDLVSRINGEPVGDWDPERYDDLISKADRADYAFIVGAQETSKSLAVVDLVP